MRKPAPRKMTPHLAAECRRLVFDIARKHDVAPALITAHVRLGRVSKARLEVWCIMVNQMGLTRQMVADMFSRDRRRLRASVLCRFQKDPRSLAPCQPVGRQFVWSFAVPMVMQLRSGATIASVRSRPLRIDDGSKAWLAEFGGERFVSSVCRGRAAARPVEEAMLLGAAGVSSFRRGR